MNFTNAVKSGFANCFKFSGRATRPEYWYFALFYVLCSTAGNVLVLSGSLLPAGPLRTVLLIGDLVILVALMVPHLAVATRRLHDTGHAGWWVGGSLVASIVAQISSSVSSPSLVLIIVQVGMSVVVLALVLIVLFWLVKPGTDGPNRFGPPPATALISA